MVLTVQDLAEIDQAIRDRGEVLSRSAVTWDGSIQSTRGLV